MVNAKKKDKPIKVYKRVNLTGTEAKASSDAAHIAKFHVFLKDRPGSLASFSSLIARSGCNISFFHYDRSVYSSRVAVEIQVKNSQDLNTLLRSLEKKEYIFTERRYRKDDVRITALENILEIKVQLVNKPGTLGTFSRILNRHCANVIYMLYDEAIDEGSADIAIATEDAQEVDTVLGVINSKGYRYSVVYRGSEEETIEHIIGLKQVEKFFLRLKELLSDADIEEVKILVDSSQELYADLVHFYHETGENVEVGDIFEKVLALASIAMSRTGERFSVTGMLPLHVTDQVKVSGFRLPTSENIYVFEHDDEIVMIDTGYGLYYEDIKRLLRNNSLDPARVKRIFITHPDADHTGAAGYFEQEFGTKVFMHKGARGVIASNNRGYGSSKLEKLNKYFTHLVTAFTKCCYPAKPCFFAAGKATSVLGDFKCIDRFSVGDLEFQVLESHGGHVPGQVFFVNMEYGLLFTSDYCINTKSLSTKDREDLSIHRDLLTSVNSDSILFREEMECLQNFINDLDKKLRKKGRYLFIFPGHGNYYSASHK